MTLITRFNRLFHADVHAVLDRIEEPEALLKQAIREMESALDRDRMLLKQQEHKCAIINERRLEADRSGEQLKKELDICFNNNNEMLARRTIKRKLELLRYISLLTNQHESLKNSISEIEQRTIENQKKLDTVNQKLEMLSINSNTNNEDDIFSSKIMVNDDEIEIEYLREKQQRTSS